MKNKHSALLKFGLSKKTVLNLSETQVNLLYNRLIVENETPGILKVPAGSDAERVAQREKRPYMTYEGEVTEKKKTKDNPWAICTSQLSDEFGTSKRSDWSKSQKRKYERCVKDVKKTMEEDFVLEKKIVEMVKKEVNPSIKKKDFKSFIKSKGETIEQKESPSVSKPRRPKVKQEENPKLDSISKPRRPKVKQEENPKKKETTENIGMLRAAIPIAKGINTISKLSSNEQEVAPSPPKTSPDVKPGVRPPKPDKKNPFKPKHKPNPKAVDDTKSSLPSWLRYGSIFNK